MKKRFVLTVLVSVFGLFAALNFATASAASPTMGQRIWCGMSAGASFNVSLDAANCQPQQSATTSSGQASPSNSGTGTSRTYVALGDSVAAGLGLAGSASNSCGRSTGAYSTAVASALQMQVANYACSGATAGDLVTAQHIDGPNPPAQLKQAFQNGTPDLITITAGANDAHWADFIQACYTTNCATNANTQLANAFLVSLQAKLYYSLYNIYARSNGMPPEVILTGYYQPFSPACSAVQSQLTPQEIAWLSAEVNALNQTIRQVSAHFSFAKFAPVDFAGHDVCSASSWIQGPTDPAPFHPNAQGQAAIAQAVLKLVD